MPRVTSQEKRAVAAIRPVQLDLFTAPPVSVGKDRAHHAVAALVVPVASISVAAPVSSHQGGATTYFDRQLIAPVGYWMGMRHGGFYGLLLGVGRAYDERRA